MILNEWPSKRQMEKLIRINEKMLTSLMKIKDKLVPKNDYEDVPDMAGRYLLNAGEDIKKGQICFRHIADHSCYRLDPSEKEVSPNVILYIATQDLYEGQQGYFVIHTEPKPDESDKNITEGE